MVVVVMTVIGTFVKKEKSVLQEWKELWFYSLKAFNKNRKPGLMGRFEMFLTQFMRPVTGAFFMKIHEELVWDWMKSRRHCDFFPAVWSFFKHKGEGVGEEDEKLSQSNKREPQKWTLMKEKCMSHLAENSKWKTCNTEAGSGIIWGKKGNQQGEGWKRKGSGEGEWTGTKLNATSIKIR